MIEITEHLTHPGHNLLQLESNKEYLCGCCKTFGSGKTFQCSSCSDFNMHEFCAKCPEQLSTFMHPLHRLSLVVRKAHGMRKNNRTCDVCEDDIEGYFYRCKDCDFDLHPVCTELPQNLRHALHVEHPLVLQKPTIDAPCCVCKGICKTWRYRCGECDGFDIHLDCVLVVVSSTTTRNIQFSPPYTLQTPPQPPFHGACWVPPGYSYPYLQQPPLHGGGWGPPGYSYPYLPQPPHHGGGVPPVYSYPYHNMYNFGFVNAQAHLYSPVYHHHHQPGYVQAYNMYNPAFSMYNSTHYNPSGCANCKPQAHNEMNNPDVVGTPQGNENQDHHVGSPNKMQNCAKHDDDHHHQQQQQIVGSNMKMSRRKRMFKVVGELAIGVLSSVIFGVAFPGLSD